MAENDYTAGPTSLWEALQRTFDPTGRKIGAADKARAAQDAEAMLTEAQRRNLYFAAHPDESPTSMEYGQKKATIADTNAGAYQKTQQGGYLGAETSNVYNEMGERNLSRKEFRDRNAGGVGPDTAGKEAEIARIQAESRSRNITSQQQIDQDEEAKKAGFPSYEAMQMSKKNQQLDTQIQLQQQHQDWLNWQTNIKSADDLSRALNDPMGPLKAHFDTITGGNLKLRAAIEAKIRAGDVEGAKGLITNASQGALNSSMAILKESRAREKQDEDVRRNQSEADRRGRLQEEAKRKEVGAPNGPVSRGGMTPEQRDQVPTPPPPTTPRAGNAKTELPASPTGAPAIDSEAPTIASVVRPRQPTNELGFDQEPPSGVTPGRVPVMPANAPRQATTAETFKGQPPAETPNRVYTPAAMTSSGQTTPGASALPVTPNVGMKGGASIKGANVSAAASNFAAQGEKDKADRAKVMAFLTQQLMGRRAPGP